MTTDKSQLNQNNVSQSNRKVGRPTINPDTVFTKIQPYLDLGYSVHKSCILALIPYRAVIEHYNNNEDFRNKCERARNDISITARSLLKKAIEDGNLNIAKFWLETQEKDEWSKRTEVNNVTPENEGILLLRQIITERRKERNETK